MKTKCKACKGTGWDNRSTCMNCNGSGLKLKKEMPNHTIAQLQVDKAELLEALEEINSKLNIMHLTDDRLTAIYNTNRFLIQKHKK